LLYLSNNEKCVIPLENVTRVYVFAGVIYETLRIRYTKWTHVVQMDVCCMLFTDMLLVTKPATKRGAGDKVKIIKAPMRLDKIVVYGLRDAGTYARHAFNQLFDYGKSRRFLPGTRERVMISRTCLMKTYVLKCRNVTQIVVSDHF